MFNIPKLAVQAGSKEITVELVTPKKKLMASFVVHEDVLKHFQTSR